VHAILDILRPNVAYKVGRHHAGGAQPVDKDAVRGKVLEQVEAGRRVLGRHTYLRYLRRPLSTSNAVTTGPREARRAPGTQCGVRPDWARSKNLGWNRGQIVRVYMSSVKET